MYQQYALPCHPPDGQHSSALYAVIVHAVQIPTHAKISYFNGVVATNQTVSSSQISVDEVERFQIFHARCNLCCHVDERTIAKTQMTQSWI